MAVALAQKAGLAVVESQLKIYEPEDPLYENYKDNKGKIKRRKRELPPGLSKRDEKILRKVKSRAHHLDKNFMFCGMRFGWTFVIGIVPVVGDALNAYLSYSLVIEKSIEAGLPDGLVTRMLLNNMIAIGIGLIPVAGNLSAAIFKANSRNVALLEKHLRIRGAKFLKAEAESNTDAAVSAKLDKKEKKSGSKFVRFFTRKGENNDVTVSD